jgi:flagellar motor switch/type III secretory pathway protein FliN
MGVEGTAATLEASNDANDLFQSHRMVQDYWGDTKDAVATHFDHLMGRPWSSDDLLLFSRLNKEPVVFHEIKASERTVLGLFIQNRYDVKFAPVEPGDQDLSDVWNKLYTAVENQQRWNFQDIDFFRQAWAGGTSYQEVYVKVSPGREPKICTRNQNFFAIYDDPESRDFILRRDRRFIDRVSWLTAAELVEEHPDKVNLKALQDENDEGAGAYQKERVYRDRSHEAYDRKNGKYKVIERFYKVKKKALYAMSEDSKRMDIQREDLETFRTDYPEQEIYGDDSYELHLAIACPAWDASEYLYKGPYHCNPVDEQGEIIWPILEMVAEGLNGEAAGFVGPQESPSKIINSMMSNILGSAKHAANTSYLRKANAFTDEREAKLFDKHHSDNDRVFKVKDNVQLNEVVAPIPKGEVNRDNTQALEFALAFMDKIGSTPPALQGQTEEKGASGILNAQRIEQAYIQLQVLIANWKMYLSQRAKLVQYYIRKYYPYEKTFRIVQKDSKQEPFLTINQMVPAQDPMGREAGALQKLNDITTSEYDIVIEDSYQSPTYRYKTQQQISELLQSPAVQADPVLMGMLLVEFAKLSDISSDLKEFIEQHSMAVRQEQAYQSQQQQQMAEQEQRAGALANMASMQGIAQAEAEQTAMPSTGAPVAPTAPPAGPQGAAGTSLRRRPTAFSPRQPAMVPA